MGPGFLASPISESRIRISAGLWIPGPENPSMAHSSLERNLMQMKILARFDHCKKIRSKRKGDTSNSRNNTHTYILHQYVCRMQQSDSNPKEPHCIFNSGNIEDRKCIPPASQQNGAASDPSLPNSKENLEHNFRHCFSVMMLSLSPNFCTTRWVRKSSLIWPSSQSYM